MPALRRTQGSSSIGICLEGASTHLVSAAAGPTIAQDVCRLTAARSTAATTISTFLGPRDCLSGLHLSQSSLNAEL